MSKDIILKTDEFSSRSVNRSKSELSDVSKTMETIKTELYAAYYDCGATHKRIFSASTIEAVGKGCNTAHSAWIRLGRIAQFLDDGPEKLLAVDRSTKSKYTNAWDRFTNSLGGGFGVVIGGVSSFWNNLFVKNKNKTGNSVVINPYGYLADRFDWGKTTVSQEEIDSAIAEAIAASGGINTEETIAQNLEKLYREKTDPYYQYREKADKANDAVRVGEKQKDDLCTYASTATLLRRKQAISEKNPTFTRDQVLSQNGNMAFGYQYKDDDGNVYSTTYESSGTVRQRMSRMGINSITEYLAELLKQHPAGVVVYSKHPNNVHAIVITDFVIDETSGKIQLFADDPVNNANDEYTSGRVPIEKTWLYEQNPNFLEELNWIWY